LADSRRLSGSRPCKSPRCLSVSLHRFANR
jgi:hypothetical protein